MRHEAPVTGSKICRGECGRELHVMAFAAAPEAPDGMHAKCRECEAKLAGGRRSNRYRSRRNDVMDLD